MIRIAVILSLSLVASAAAAKELRIGFVSEPNSIDPHFHNFSANNSLRRHIFSALVETDEAKIPRPELAEAWRALDDRTWEFKLRPNLVFSNGAPLTASDVIYSLCRVPVVVGSPGSFAFATKSIVGIDAPDTRTILIRTAEPDPLLPVNLSTVGIVNAERVGGNKDVKFRPGGCESLGTNPASSDFGDASVAIGAGPYRLEGYTRGQKITLKANDNYWEGQPNWSRVTIQPVPNAGSRVAALLSGDLDVIEFPSIQDQKTIQERGFVVAQGLSTRVLFVAFDVFSDQAWRSPTIKGSDSNPLLDARVRRALSKAINREAIVRHLMGGAAVPAGELLPWPLFGASENAPIEPFDPDEAKRLLKEAGYPNGFEIGLGAPNDRFVNDEKVAQAVAQMWSRIGVRTTVDAMTVSLFYMRRNKYEFSAYLMGWGADTGEMSNSLTGVALTPNPTTGYGRINSGRYSNPTVDDLTIRALTTINNEERRSLLQRASRLAMQDYAILPLHFEVATWAMRKGLKYGPRVDQYTVATDIQETSAQ